MEIATLPNQVASSSQTGYSSNRLEYPPIGKLTPNARKVAKPVLLRLRQKDNAGSIVKSEINETRESRIKLHAAALKGLS